MTAQELILISYSQLPSELEDIENIMIEFARYHVEQALIETDNNLSIILEENRMKEMNQSIIGKLKKSILESYSLYKIK